MLPSNTTQLTRVAIMGGTFDPIHYGHLAAAEEVAEHYDLEQVIFIPSAQPPHKKDYQVTPAEDRYLMTVLATNSNPRFTVSRLELDRPGPSYTIDTLRELHRALGPQCELFFITGADAVLEIVTWREADKVLQEARFLAVHRPGYDLSKLAAAIGEEKAARIEPFGLRGLDISSTDLRARVAAGRSLRYLTPDAVIDYIRGHGLYGHPDGQKPGLR